MEDNRNISTDINRGDVFYVTGYKKNVESEQDQSRPAIVVSNNKCNTYSPVVEVVFLTSVEKAKYMPTHVEIMCQIPSIALCEQVHSISKGRLGEYIRTCTDEEMGQVNKALMLSLGIKQEIKPPSASVISNKERDDLMMKLEGAERMLDEEKAMCEQLKIKLKMKENEIKDLNNKQEDNARKIQKQDSSENNPDMIKVLTERNLYEKLYHEILDQQVLKGFKTM